MFQFANCKRDYQRVNKHVDPENRPCFNGNSSSKADDCQGQQVNLPEGNSFEHGFDWNYLRNFSGIQKNILFFLREHNDQHYWIQLEVLQTNGFAHQGMDWPYFHHVDCVPTRVSSIFESCFLTRLWEFSVEFMFVFKWFRIFFLPDVPVFRLNLAMVGWFWASSGGPGASTEDPKSESGSGTSGPTIQAWKRRCRCCRFGWLPLGDWMVHEWADFKQILQGICIFAL